MRRIFFLVPLLALFPAFVFADLELNLTYPSFGGVDIKSVVDTPQAIPGLIAWAYALIVGISGFVAFIMLVWGGVQWMGSAGDPGAIRNALDRIKSAILGLLLILTSFLLLEVVNPDVVKLSPLNLPGFTVPKTVKAPPPPREELYAFSFTANNSDQGANVRPGENVALMWEVGKGYQRCEGLSDPATPLWGGNVGTSGTKEFVALAKTQRFDLACFKNASTFESRTLFVTATEQALEPGSTPTVNLFVSSESLRSKKDSDGPFKLILDGSGPGDFKDNQVKFVWESNAEQCAGGDSLAQATQPKLGPRGDTAILFFTPEFSNGEYTFTITCSSAQFALPSSDSVTIDMKF